MSRKPSPQRTKAQLVEELNALRVMEREHRLLLDESSDPIFAFFPDGRYRYVNHAFAAGVDRDRRDIVGHSIWDIFSKEEADRRFAAVRWVFENGQSKVIEVRVPRADGDRDYVTTVKPIFGDHAEVVSVICVSKDITERRIMEEKLARMALHDGLTDLPNRVLVADRLGQALSEAVRRDSRIALMLVDFDDFKAVNDTLGHSAGDLLLQQAARRLLACVRKSDTVGRLGGDEFVVVVPGIEDERDAMVLAEKIRRALNQPFELPGSGCKSISSSIGVAIYPDHGRSEIELSMNADGAMYQAKSRGRNRVQLFQPHCEPESIAGHPAVSLALRASELTPAPLE